MSSQLLADPADFAAARPYPERSEVQADWHDRLAEFLVAAVQPFRDMLRDPAKRYERIGDLVDLYDRELRAASDTDLLRRAKGMRARLRRNGFVPALVGECFALVRESASRTIGKRHYESQLIAGWALLEGRLAEMATGEGKTFAASLPACTVALAGYPVHIVTVNDYLATRDAEQMQPLYAFLGLDVGTVVQGMPVPERRAAYARSITYCTNKELTFDYLKDNVALARRCSRLHVALDKLRSDHARDERLILRGLHFAIVDEADSVFIDEARTPLILSATTADAEDEENCRKALEIAASLTLSEDYAFDQRERSITLSETGRDRIAEFGAALAGIWTSQRAREELVQQALSARLLFQRDQHYVVSAGKIQIVDESTGRVMPDRSWERGLHQMIEAKEGCALTARRETLARITYQRLFRRYLRLSGMTGTAKETAREIKALYRLNVVRIPLHKPSQRVRLPGRVCRTAQEKWQAVADVTARFALDERRPVLIGTRSVEASEQLSAVLAQRGIEHALLNAKQDESEAEIIGRAGEAGRVTVATNMAGRGTDIHLEPGVAERGGLHVILTEYHESQRVDRQLFGRCARQGDPGTCEAIVSLDDALFNLHASSARQAVAALSVEGRLAQRLVHRVLRRLAQFSAERRHANTRLQNFKHDRQLEQVLAFSGRGE
jgi:preprotein translocase subunit SecA